MLLCEEFYTINGYMRTNLNYDYMIQDVLFLLFSLFKFFISLTF